MVLKGCPDIADSLDNRGRRDAIIIDFWKAFNLVPNVQLLTKISYINSIWKNESAITFC
jgi:hypothetical protein